MNDQTQQATVQTAVELTKTEKEELVSILSKMTGQKNINLVTEVNPEVLGGLRVEIGDWVLDTTISNQLSKLSEALTKAA